MYKVKLNRVAQNNRKQILKWYYDINPKLTTKFENHLESTKQFISQNPKATQTINPNNPNIRKKPLSTTFPYNIIYQIDELQKTIIILTIRHNKRNEYLN